ncbi:hypothetical protein D1818_23445 [Aquimarina sp. BL5]|uniref:hypothetical protein n=1 Tax=Aquimarina sp. BL5 TaxID=1714860 RepID=UPI000E4ED23F|nr:hypothetical protein [Aquimarina sp. BL5]AXT53635.1 hypothetical protein D1818_23445 [Aquimarina sp. BL5]RKN05043.1 hypothetical protein D7036_11300 [Aquimarina sp. BL5]
MESDVAPVIIQLLTGLFYAIPTIIFIVISIYYLMKIGSKTDGVLILIGNIILFLSIVVNQILFIQLSVYQSWDGYYYSYISTALSILSFIGSILFVIGVFLLMKKVIKTKSLTGTIIDSVTEDTTS